MTFDNINQIIEHTNLAAHIDKKELEEMGSDVVSTYQEDLESRSEWEKRNEMWMELASQVMEDKNFPWPNSSNVKYPLLTTSAMQFHARAYQSLVKGANPVLVRPFGKDPTGEKRARADRLSTIMSYQLLQEMDNWQEDLDRLLLVLPVIGLCFKKVYWSPTKQRNVSELVLPKDLVVNYHAKDFETCRKHHRLYKTGNEVLELQNTGLYREVDLGTPAPVQHSDTEDKTVGLSPSFSEDDEVHTIIESHTLWDLNGDGHKEPYIITVDLDSQEVLRVTARFDVGGIVYKEGKPGEVASIEGKNFFVKYSFIPDLNSSIYALGFGAILGPLNSAINTLTNQLIDAGTLGILPVGFLGRGIRLGRGGTVRFKPGEWKGVNNTGDDLRKGVFPLPVREPSQTLFNLLGMLAQSGEKVGSIADIMLGENPGQNQPYSTTSAVLEQGLQVFQGIFRRVFRSLSNEYQMIYTLNHHYLDQERYSILLDDPEGLVDVDFNLEDFDVIPAADPDIVTEVQRQLKAEALAMKLQMGFPLNKELVLRKMLEAEGHDDIDELMDAEPPPEDPELVFKKQQHQDQMSLEAMRLKLEASTKEFEALKDQAQAILNFQKAQTESAADPEREMEFQFAQKQMDALFKAQDKAMDRQAKEAEMSMKLQGQREEMMAKQQASSMDLDTQRQKANLDLEKQAAQNALARQAPTKDGPTSSET
jgi:chaperonin GroES